MPVPQGQGVVPAAPAPPPPPAARPAEKPALAKPLPAAIGN